MDFMFEASVGGGIPIIRPLKSCLAANKVSSVMGIVNGTTNYMLTKMSQENMDYADVLREAQEKTEMEKAIDELKAGHEVNAGAIQDLADMVAGGEA